MEGTLVDPLPTTEPTELSALASGQAVVVIDGASRYLGPWQSPESRAEYVRIIAEWLAYGRASSEGRSNTIWEHRERQDCNPDQFEFRITAR